MAKSKYEYTRTFELDSKCLKNVWMVVRLDGRGFHKFTERHSFVKPNDARALELMNEAAKAVMNELQDIFISYGQSDEYSFVFKRSSTLYGRRSDKIMSAVCSIFTSNYVLHWSKYFDSPLLSAPSFDGRVVMYPTDRDLRNYLCWRQADCHINNLYNTCFWTLVQKGGFTVQAAEKELSGTVSSEKNELLFTQFNMNYNKELEMFRKGSTLVWSEIEEEGKKKKKKVLSVLSCDIIGDSFWEEYPALLAD